MKRIYIKPSSEIVKLRINGSLMAADTPSYLPIASTTTTHGSEDAKSYKFDFDEYEEDSEPGGRFSLWDEE